jgi:hypothetical protein
VKATERATRVELRGIGVDLAESALGRAAVDLAKRLDAAPGDRAAAMLVRELRLVMGALRAQVKGDATSDVEEYLRRVSTPAYDAGH